MQFAAQLLIVFVTITCAFCSLHLHQVTKLMRKYGQKKITSSFIVCSRPLSTAAHICMQRVDKTKVNIIAFLLLFKVVVIVVIIVCCQALSFSTEKMHAYIFFETIVIRSIQFYFLLTMITLEKWLSGLFQS